MKVEVISVIPLFYRSTRRNDDRI